MSIHHPSAFPTLDPAYIFKLNLGQGRQVGTIFTGSSFAHYDTPSGTIESVEGFEPKIQAQIIYGGDWLYFDADKKHARLNIKGLAKDTEGAILSFTITGILTASKEIAAIFGKSPDAKTIPFGLSSFTHSFEVGEGKYKELEDRTWVGNGRFIVSDQGITLESRVSQLVPSTAMD